MASVKKSAPLHLRRPCRPIVDGNRSERSEWARPSYETNAGAESSSPVNDRGPSNGCGPPTRVRCSNCGLKIPYYGKVCPYCRADRTEGKEDLTVAKLIVTPCAVIGGAVGWLFPAVHGLVVGPLIGLTVGACPTGAAMHCAAKWRENRSGHLHGA
jgi:hypothetical protein